MTKDDVGQMLTAAAQFLNANNLGPAEELIVAVLAANPNEADALHMLGHVLLRRGELTEAIRILERAVMARPADPEIRVSLATALGMSERYADVVAVCRTGLQNAPDSVVLLVVLGRALGVLGAHEDAVDALEKANELAPPDPVTLTMLGTLYFRLGDLARSASAYESALKLAPDDIETRYHMVSLHIRNLDYEAAIAGLQGILKLNGDHLPSLRSLGNILSRTDRYREAIKPLQQALALDPNDKLSVNELIYAEAIAGDPAKAVALGQAYLNDHPDATFIHRQLAFAQFLAGQPKMAVTRCDQALKCDRPPTTALSIKAAALNELGARDAAADILRLDSFVQAQTPTPPEPTAQFNEALQTEILNHPSLEYMPSNRSMKQGRGTVELFDGTETGAIATFKQMIIDAVDTYIQALPDEPEHPFIRHRPQNLDVNAWGNVYDDDGMQKVHFHPPAWLSGVYYPIVPDRIKQSAPDDLAGALELGRAYYRLESADTPPVRVIKPEDGLMVLFPSYIGHQTVPLGPSKTPRVSIAFDLVPAR